jgi:ankyrin repeat protein
MAEAARLFATAFENDDCKAIRLYIKKGYNCSAVDSETQSTFLHLVMRLRCTDCDKSSMAQSLIKGGNPVDARDKLGFTPLMICSYPALATVLLHHSADINACSSDITSLLQAVLNSNLPLVQLLLSRGASVNAEDSRSKTALNLACENFRRKGLLHHCKSIAGGRCTCHRAVPFAWCAA